MCIYNPVEDLWLSRFANIVNIFRKNSIIDVEVVLNTSLNENKFCYTRIYGI